MLKCSSETFSFHKVPAELALPRTVDAVSHVNLELETDVELYSWVMSAATATKPLTYVRYLIEKSEKPCHFLHDAFRIRINCFFFHRNQRILESFLQCLYQMLWFVLRCAACLDFNPWTEIWLTLDWLGNFAYVDKYPNAAVVCWKKKVLLCYTYINIKISAPVGNVDHRTVPLL